MRKTAWKINQFNATAPSNDEAYKEYSQILVRLNVSAFPATFVNSLLNHRYWDMKIRFN